MWEDEWDNKWEEQWGIVRGYFAKSTFLEDIPMAMQRQDSTYTYNALNNSHIRLVELMSFEPTMNIDLTDVPDATSPEYFALSYAWGSEQNTETILCSGKSFKITSHLREALKCLSTTWGRRKLWIDAICINQDNDEEKAVQVSKMHHIYSKAKGVCVWLGKEEDDSDAAISAINNVQDATSDQMPFMEGILAPKSGAVHLFDISVFKPLASLSRRAWFGRLWIVQEYILGKDVHFFCGMSVMTDTKFTSVLRRLSIYVFGGEEPPGFQEEEDLFTGFRALTDLKEIRNSHFEGNRLSFFDVVMLGRERSAKEPVDRVYAALGMAEGSDDIYRKEIPIDYSEDARRNYWRLYSNFGKVALVHEPNLRMLSFVSSVARLESLPSWCPNLNSPMLTAELDEPKVYAAGWTSEEHGNDQGDSASESPKCLRHAQFRGKNENHVHTSLLTNTISIWGTTLDRISLLGPCCEWDTDVVNGILNGDLLSIRPLAKGLLEWLVSNQKICRSRVDDPVASELLWSDILVGATENSRRDKSVEDKLDPKVEQPKVEGDAAYRFMTTILGNIAYGNPDSDDTVSESDLLRHFEPIYAWIYFMHLTWHGRLLFVTDSGKFGFASAEIGKGDSVCMLYGGRSMYVLRERTSEPLEYQFISDAYLFGCMDGQVFDMIDEGLAQEELFAIS